MIHQILISQLDFVVQHLCSVSLLFTFSYNLLLFTHTIILIIAIGFGLYFYLTKRKLTKQLKRVEQQLILSQINPHFFFNSLTALQSYIFRNDALQAGKFLSTFAKFVRLVLESSRLELSSIEQEVKILNFYFELQSLRFEDKFEYKIEVDENLEIDLPSIPPLLTQPFIENAIEHGLIQLNERGIIVIRFIKQNDFIVIEIDDNGIGFEKTMQHHLRSGRSPHTFAKDLTFVRIEKVKEINNMNVFIDIIDKSNIDQNTHGSIIRFSIPIN